MSDQSINDALAAAHRETQAVREKLKNAIRKGKAIDAERAELQRQLAALKDALPTQAAPDGASSDGLVAAEHRFAEQLERLAAQHAEKREQLQQQADSAMQQLAKEQDNSALLQASQQKASRAAEASSAAAEVA
eukprot:CAMPEP_0206143054 /NCGR_PEP_ID=MMETSP1473-20131121/19156_1 /ASSEMBLY_ACC=CAM_ASM_001109 /TAXON_ID=1461547 /ORGANISM="Stichococcus sp, Strain RCC1054" /LENGTH=133 /DNA_ID=CAMNT_0053538291 /DNA_START=256 /DNA_END=653 /DNA_ORIENTATION=+